MAIKHATTKAAGQKLFAVADWNADHSADINLVVNLNADLLDGNHASAFLTAEADTLQSVTNRGNTTTNMIIGSDKIATLNGKEIMSTDATSLADFYTGSHMAAGADQWSVWNAKFLNGAIVDFWHFFRDWGGTDDLFIENWMAPTKKIFLKNPTSTPHTFTSTLADGTKPFTITSTTLNTNLNADLWDGYQFSDYLNQAVKTTSSPQFAELKVGAGTKYGMIYNEKAYYSSSASDTPSMNTEDGTNNYLGSGAYWGIRTGTTNHEFNLDMYNAGSVGTAIKVLQNKNVYMPTKLSVGASTLYGAMDVYGGPLLQFSGTTTGTGVTLEGSATANQPAKVYSNYLTGANVPLWLGTYADQDAVVINTDSSVDITNAGTGIGLDIHGASYPSLRLISAGANGGQAVFTSSTKSWYQYLQANDLIFNDGADRVTFQAGGNVGIGTAVPTALLDVNSDILRLRTAKTPANAGDTGNAGDICWDANYIYVCTATNTWKRSAIATW